MATEENQLAEDFYFEDSYLESYPIFSSDICDPEFINDDAAEVWTHSIAENYADDNPLKLCSLVYHCLAEPSKGYRLFPSVAPGDGTYRESKSVGRIYSLGSPACGRDAYLKHTYLNKFYTYGRGKNFQISVGAWAYALLRVPFTGAEEANAFFEKSSNQISKLDRININMYTDWPVFSLGRPCVYPLKDIYSPVVRDLVLRSMAVLNSTNDPNVHKLLNELAMKYILDYGLTAYTEVKSEAAKYGKTVTQVCMDLPAEVQSKAMEVLKFHATYEATEEELKEMPKDLEYEKIDSKYYRIARVLNYKFFMFLDASGNQDLLRALKALVRSYQEEPDNYHSW